MGYIVGKHTHTHPKLDMTLSIAKNYRNNRHTAKYFYTLTFAEFEIGDLFGKITVIFHGTNFNFVSSNEVHETRWLLQNSVN